MALPMLRLWHVYIILQMLSCPLISPIVSLNLDDDCSDDDPIGNKEMLHIFQLESSSTNRHVAMEWRPDDDNGEGSGIELAALSRDKSHYWESQPLDTML